MTPEEIEKDSDMKGALHIDGLDIENLSEEDYQKKKRWLELQRAIEDSKYNYKVKK